ncbi:hypothetical protein ACU8KH_00034 [Lachancea thermotolerans]
MLLHVRFRCKAQEKPKKAVTLICSRTIEICLQGERNLTIQFVVIALNVLHLVLPETLLLLALEAT